MAARTGREVLVATARGVLLLQRGEWPLPQPCASTDDLARSGFAACCSFLADLMFFLLADVALGVLGLKAVVFSTHQA